jgi:tetrahydromethanopterin S-methyltransferase subunit G
MPLYGSYLQRFAHNFFENLDENLIFNYNEEDIIDIKKTEKRLDEIIKLIDEIMMEMMYEGKYAEYYDKFAKENNEENLLKESGYIMFDLDEYYIELENGNYRPWLYEKEINDVRIKLKKTKKKIENHINSFNIRAGISLALIRNYKE